jgi:4-amino-4-deoxy-L-arabinose transferase-like glycosyltransferase
LRISFNDIAENKRWSLLLLTSLGSLFFLGIGQTHLFDWDEINFAESAREMIHSGDYLRVQINYEPFWEKPPLFIWMQVLSMKVFGINEFAARFPNAVFGVIYLITIYLIGRKHFSGKFGLIWALLYCGSLLPNAYFKSGIIDPSFNFFIFMSIYFMIRVISGENEINRGSLALLSGLFSGLSVITKGPVGFLLLGLTLFAYLIIKRFKPFPKLKYILLFSSGLLGAILIWLTIEFSQNGFEIIREFIAYQAELFNSNVAGHQQPFYYHFVVVFFGCFPISIIGIPSLLKKRSDTVLDFHLWMICLFWVVLLLFSIVTTKIIHYSSMTWIPLSFVAAYSIYLVDQKKIALPRFTLWGYLGLGLIMSSIFIAITILIANNWWLANHIDDPFVSSSLRQNIELHPLSYVIGFLLLFGVIIGFIFLKRSNFGTFAIINASSVMAAFLIACFTLLPTVEQFTQGPAIAYYKRSHEDGIPVVSFQFKSYGRFFYSKTDKHLEGLDWFLSVPNETPLYFVSKQGNDWLSRKFKFDLIDCKGGYCLYRKNPVASDHIE